MAANNLKDEGMRMVRQASDEGKSAALKVWLYIIELPAQHPLIFVSSL